MKNSASLYILYVTEKSQCWHEKAYSIRRWPWTLRELEGRLLLSDKGEIKLVISVSADRIFRLWHPKLNLPYIGLHKGAHIAKSTKKTLPPLQKLSSVLYPTSVRSSTTDNWINFHSKCLL